MRSKVHVKAGVCGFETDIEVKCEGMTENAKVSINTQCKNVQKLADTIKEVDGMSELRGGLEGKIYTEAKNIFKGGCASCVVPSSILKAIHVAYGMALPKDVQISISKEVTRNL